MKNLLFAVLLIALSATIFAQSYEPMLNRPDITGLTGGTATDLDGIPTAGLAEGTIVIVNVASEARLYRLEVSGDAESSPAVIRADDYATTGKLWRTAITADPEETGYTPTGDNLGNHTATTTLNLDGNYLSGDGDAEGIYVNADGNVGINQTSIGTNQFQIGQGEVVDQQNTTTNSICGWGDVAQTFTAGMDGMLTAVEIEIWIASAPQVATLTIYSGEGNGGPILTTQAVTISQVAGGTPTRFDLLTPVAIMSGNFYTFCISGCFGITTSVHTTDPYPGGKVCNGCNDCTWQAGMWDMWFKTYVKQGDPVAIDASGNVGIGTTTPSSKLDVVGLPVYANNAAAIVGGLTVGAFYRTGADPDVVCVVH